MIDEECQKRINEVRDKSYALAKARIQFPVCACHFADDEETLISPCAAHLRWKNESRGTCNTENGPTGWSHFSCGGLINCGSEVDTSEWSFCPFCGSALSHSKLEM